MSHNICNICGANYEYRNGRWVCPACGAYKQEELSNEEATLLYNAAQKLRLCDFDEAEKAYTDIIEKYPKNPNGYWGRLMSRYGIKYEEDFDGKRIPTCYAASIESVLSDKDYLTAVELADDDTKEYYRKQAEYIERVRKEWVEKARHEKPYDVFICYKDSDSLNGNERTKDSIVAQELYIHLTEQGYRVFFSRESLRGKVGEKYEPYIFNALSTAKVMLVYGSSSEYISSTWVKNEWTRYEKHLQAGEKKANSLIVACDGFSPAELPKVLSSMQCFDATKHSFYTDLDAVLKRIIKGEEKQKPVVAEKPEKKKSRRLPFAIATVAVVVMAVLLCVLLPNILGNKPISSIVDSKYGVVISAENKIFEKNTSVIAEQLTDGTQYISLISAINNAKSVDVKNAIIYDIECDADISQNVTVKVAYAKSFANSTVKVYYVSDDKSTIEEHSCICKNGFVEFKTNHLSYYVIGEILQSAEIPGGDSSITIKNGVLQVGICADNEPYEYIENGEIKGIEIDILKAIANKLDLIIEFKNMAFEDLHPSLLEEQIDCVVGMTETAELNEHLVASIAMLEDAVSEYIIYTKKGRVELQASLNISISQLKTEGTISEIINEYSTVIEEASVVVFCVNGGVGNMESLAFDTNKPITLPKCTFIKEGYSFDGWSTSPSGDAIYSDQGQLIVESSGEYTLYAVWTVDYYQINYVLNGGTNNEFNPAEYSVTDATIILKDPIRIGYTFCGWYSDASLNEECNQILSGSVGNKSFYASWEATDQLLYFSANGGTGNMEPIVGKTDSTIVLPPVLFEREGYSFDGWAVTPEGDVVYADQAKYLVGTQDSVALFAHWTEIYTPGLVFQTVDGFTYSVTGYTGSSENVVIPAEYNGLPVTTIGSKAFYCNTNLKTISFTDNIVYILDNAFYGCTSLSNVTLPPRLNTIGDCAFENCNEINEIIIPKSVTQMGVSVFTSSRQYLYIRCEIDSQPEGWANSWQGYWKHYINGHQGYDERTTISWGYGS